MRQHDIRLLPRSSILEKHLTSLRARQTTQWVEVGQRKHKSSQQYNLMLSLIVYNQRTGLFAAQRGRLGIP